MSYFKNIRMTPPRLTIFLGIFLGLLFFLSFGLSGFAIEKGLFDDNAIWRLSLSGNRVYTGGALLNTPEGLLLAGGKRIRGRTSAVVTMVDRKGSLIWETPFSAGEHYSQFFTTLSPLAGGYLACGEVKAGDEEGTKLLLVKYSLSGKVLWYKKLGDAIYSGCRLMKPAPDGAYLAALARRDPENPLESFIYIYKIDLQGNVLWKKSWQRHKNAQPAGMVVAGDRIFVSGFETGGLGNNYYFLSSFSSAGDEKWYRKYRTGYLSVIYDMVGTQDGLIVAGETYREESPQANCFYAKYNRQGEMIWERSIEDRYGSACKSAGVDTEGVILAGNTFVDQSGGFSDIWKVGIKSDGSLKRSKTIDEKEGSAELIQYAPDREAKKRYDLFLIYVKDAKVHYELVYREW